MRAPEFWSKEDAASRLAVAALTPVGWIYGAVTDWKRRHAVPHRAQTKIVCVGNLTAGGSGKTPVVAALVQMLQARHPRTAILSRGYGGKLTGPLIVDRAAHAAGDIGDEPLMLSATAPVIVARNRRAGADLADAHGTQVLVMDDGHQNFLLRKDVSIVVVDAEQGFGNGRILPAGPLRESVAGGLARADLVVLVGEGAPKLPGYSGPVVRARLGPADGVVLAGRRIVAFAGIGRPEKFFATLRSLDAVLVDTIAFADHHVFSASEIARLRAKARNENATLMTTEKDFVRLAPMQRDGIESLPVRAVFDAPETVRDIVEAGLARGDAP